MTLKWRLSFTMAGLLVMAFLVFGEVQLNAQPSSGFGEIQSILTANCTSCHGGDSPAANLNLTAAVAYENLVNRPSTSVPSLMRVNPGNPQLSYLFLKITDQHLENGGRGRLMPLGGVRLPDADLTAIERWIAEGAPE